MSAWRYDHDRTRAASTTVGVVAGVFHLRADASELVSSGAEASVRNKLALHELPPNRLGEERA